MLFVLHIVILNQTHADIYFYVFFFFYYTIDPHSIEVQCHSEVWSSVKIPEFSDAKQWGRDESFHKYFTCDVTFIHNPIENTSVHK